MSLLSTPLDDLLGTRSRVAVIRTLARAPESLSGREIARRGRMSPQAALDAIRALIALGLIEGRIITTSQSLYSLNRTTLIYRGLIESLVEGERSWTSTLLHALRRYVEQVAARSEGGILWAGLFGSVARGSDTPDSDIDVAIVAESATCAADLRDANAELVERVSTEIGRRVSTIVLPLEQLTRLRDAGDPLVGALQKDSRQLHGDRTLAELLDN